MNIINTSRLLYMKTPPYPNYISAGKSILKPGETHVNRIFTTFVAMFVIEGKLYLTENDLEYEIEKGQWFIQTPGLRHYGHRTYERNTIYYWIHFMPGLEWKIIEGSTLPPLNVGLLDSGEGVKIPQSELTISMQFYYFPIAKWKSLFDNMVDTVDHEYLLLAQSNFLKLLHRMQHLYLESQKSQGYDLAGNIYKFLSKNFKHKIDMKLLSKKFLFSTDYLYKCFKQRYGIPPIKCLTQIRMEYAKNQLINSNRSIQEIGHEVGYNDTSTFSRSFKLYQGISPQRYRNKVVNKFS